METGQREYRWVRLALLSAAIRVGMALVPAGFVAWFSLVMLRVLAVATGRADAVEWFGLTAAFAAVILVVFEVSASRLRTLADLYDVSMEFPYRPPTRLSVALRSPFHLELGQELDGVRRALRRRQRGGAEADRAAEHLDRVESILTLAAIIGVLEPGTRTHSHRVAELADRIAVAMGLDAQRRRWLRWAALLHDVGKLAVPEEILHKPRGLTPAEREIVRRHVHDGARIVAPVLPLLGPWARAVAEHHERWDGGGYPLGLRGDQISLAGRIVCVADTYATMTRGRIYQRRVQPAAALAELRGHAGGQFDPLVVTAFETAWRERRSPRRLLLRLPRRATSLVAAAGVSLGLPAGSSAAALGLLGAVGIAAATAPAVGHALHSLPEPALAPVEGLLGPPPGAAEAEAPSPSPEPTPSPSPHPPPTPAPATASPVSPSPPMHPPSVTVSATVNGTEGVTVAIEGTVRAMGGSPRVYVEYGDGSAIQPVPLSGQDFHLSHVYLDEGSYRFEVVAGDDQGTGSAAGTATIGEYRATLDLPSQASATGGTLSVDGQLVDPSSDPATATVDYGDGAGPQPLTLDGRTFHLAHKYPANAGTYTVTVSTRDDDGAGPSAVLTVTVPASSS